MEWDADGLMHLCDLMYKCETSFKSWNKSHLLDNDEIMLGLFQRFLYRVRAKFVSVSNEGNDSGTFQELRELVELAASEAESVYGKLMTQNRTNLGDQRAYVRLYSDHRNQRRLFGMLNRVSCANQFTNFENALYFLNKLPKIENELCKKTSFVTIVYVEVIEFLIVNLKSRVTDVANVTIHCFI